MSDASDNPLDLYSLEEAARKFFPNTGIVAGDLLAASRRKQLRVFRIGHTKLVSGQQIREYIERCQGSRVDLTSPSKTVGSGAYGTLSETEAINATQAALQAEIDRIKNAKPKKNSRNTSRRSTRFPTNVVPLKSV